MTHKKKKTATAKKKTTPVSETPSKKEEALQSFIASEFIEKDESEEKKEDINYDTLLHVRLRERELEKGEREQAEKVSFYCPDCQCIVDAKQKKGKKLRFYCPECQAEKIYFGTELGLRKFFHC